MNRHRRRRAWIPGLIVAVLLVLALLPVYWLVASSLKTPSELADIPATLWPHHVSLENFHEAWGDGELAGALGRSFLIAAVTTVLVVVFGSMSAYAASHLRYRFAPQLLGLSFVTQLLPQAAALVPIFILWRNLGLLGNLPGVTIAYIGMQLPVAVWIITGHFRSIPREVLDAAAVDGSGSVRTLLRVVLPMSAPGIAAVAIWSIIGCWSELLFALVLLSSDRSTVPVALAGMIGEHTTDWGPVLAASTIAAIPPLVLFFVLQRYFVDGISGAVKG